MKQVFFILLFLVTLSFHSLSFSQLGSTKNHEAQAEITAGYIAKMVDDDEGVKVVLKPSIVHTSDLSNSKLKTVHLSNQLKNYLILLVQLDEAQKKSQYVKIIKTSSQVEIQK